MIELVMDLVEGDEHIKKKLEFKLLTPNDEIKASKELIRKYINENKRKGFISWRNVHNALQGAEMVLDKGRNKLVNGEEDTAIRLGLAVLSIVVDMLQYTDDSEGEVAYIVNESFHLLRDASSNALLTKDHRVQENMFQLILDEALHQRYDGWSNWRHDLLDVCTIYSARTSAREKLEETFDKLSTQFSTANSWSSDNDLQEIKQLQLKILERNGELDRANQLINENLDSEEFREMAIEKEIGNGNYGTALELCEEGEENDSNYPSIVKKWKNYRLQIYEALEDVEKQKELLLEFVYNNEYEAYAKLKELYTKDEWEETLEKIFEELEDVSEYLPHVYIYIAENEQRADKILQYVEESPLTVTEFYPYLIDDYSDKVDAIFTRYIKLEAEHATERKKYRDVCEKLKIYKRACGEEKFDDLVKELKLTYHRKPAFMNELNKVDR